MTDEEDRQQERFQSEETSTAARSTRRSGRQEGFAPDEDTPTE
jgi:hypothetical protein